MVKTINIYLRQRVSFSIRKQGKRQPNLILYVCPIELSTIISAFHLWGRSFSSGWPHVVGGKEYKYFRTALEGASSALLTWVQEGSESCQEAISRKCQHSGKSVTQRSQVGAHRWASMSACLETSCHKLTAWILWFKKKMAFH